MTNSLKKRWLQGFFVGICCQKCCQIVQSALGYPGVEGRIGDDLTHHSAPLFSFY